MWTITAVLVGVVLGTTAPTALRRLGAVAALQPGLLAWYSVRALGFMAYLAIAGSVIYGLLLSTKILDAIAHRPVSFALHKDLSLVGLFLSMLHAALLLGDASFSYTPRAILIPFQSPYAPIWVGIGQLSFYAVAIVTASFYVRRQIGQRAWRLLHYVTFLAFLGATVHGISAGSDSSATWAFWLYVIAASSVVFLLTYRIVVSVAERRAAPSAQRMVAGPGPAIAPRPRLLAPAGRLPADHPAAPSEPYLAGPSFD
jgi:predicted ferric reductase